MLGVQEIAAAASRPEVNSFATTRTFPSSVLSISSYVDELMDFLCRFRETDGSEADIEVALREALLNAITHGNGGDPRKLVGVACRVTLEGEVWVTVRDQGEGFDLDAVADPTPPQNLFFSRGRGIYLMQVMMDEVWFDERGTVVHMCKKPARKVFTAV